MRLTFILAAVSTLLVAGCTQSGYGNGGIQNNGTARVVGGALAGAAVADLTGGKAGKGALYGAAAGAASCVIPGTAGCY